MEHLQWDAFILICICVYKIKSKVKDVGDVDSDSDSEIEEEEEGGSEEPPAAEPQAENPQIANPQEDANSCKVCLDAPIDTIMLPCRHTACYTCAETLKRMKSPCHLCRGVIRRLIQFFTN